MGRWLYNLVVAGLICLSLLIPFQLIPRSDTHVLQSKDELHTVSKDLVSPQLSTASISQTVVVTNTELPFHSFDTEYKLSFDPTEDLHISYEDCVQSLEGTDRTKTLKRPIQWIHFPKCGTSFGAVVYG